MISRREITECFDTLESYEDFAMEWTNVCCLLNKNSKNKTEKERFEKVVKVRKGCVSYEIDKRRRN